MEKIVQTFDTFAEAEIAERRERWAMTPRQRLRIVEHLRSRYYGPDGTPPRFQRILEIIDKPWG